MKLIKRHQQGGRLYNAGLLPEITVTPTDDQNWLFQKGKYKHNIRPFIDNKTRQYVIDYLSQFDNENAPEYNARIKRLADALEMRSMGIKKIEAGNKRAYMTSEDEIMHVGNMNDIFAELAHPWQYVFGNNERKNEAVEGYNPDKDPRGGTRYAYPDTFEGETHAFFEPALKEYIETGNIGRSSPIISKKKSKIKITPKDIREVSDSAASWDRQAINKRQIVNYSQLPLLKRIKFALTKFPLLDEVNKHKNGGIINKYQIGGYVQPSNVQQAINNGSAAGGLLEGFGRVMSKILPKWMQKAGTYLSPLNYVAALSKGSINPKVGEEVISKWHPNLQLAARTGEIILGGKAVKGAGKATVNTAAKAGNKTARAYLISKEIGKGTINQKELSNQFIEPHVTNPKGSGKVVHYDNGDGKSVFRNSGATIKNGKLVPGQTTKNQSNFTWWNQDNPYINVHKSQGRFSPSRYIITDQTNQFVHPLKAGKSVGQSDGAGRGFILPTELVSETPVSLENAQIWNKSPFGWWERVKTQQPSKITKSKPYVRWSQQGYLNEAYDIDGGPGQKFQVVKDVDNSKKGVLQAKGNGEYSLHFKSSRNNPNKEGMFQMLAESIPEGGIVSTWGKISKGGYHGINRFGEQFGWTKVGERPAVNGPVNMFQKPSVKHDRYVTALDEYGFPTDVPVKQYVSKRIEKLSSVAPDKVNYRFFPTIEQYTSMKQAGFTPKATITPGANLKAQMQENIRRLQKIYGENLPEDVKYKMKQQATKPIYLGYFETPQGGGVFSPASKISMIEPNPNDPLPRVMLHEAIMHGSDEFQTNYTAGLYQNFIDKIINSPEVVKKDGKPYYYNSLFKGVIPQKMEFPYGGDKWYEGRATFGELRKQMYDRISKNKDVSVTPETIEQLRPEFEKQVDAMNLEQASEALKHMNGYGYLYGEVGPKINPSFLSEFKSLIKYAPIGLPLLYNKKQERK